VPTTGTIIDYTNRRALHTIRWARATFDLDTTRVYAFGFSLGGTYSLQLAFLHPELISAAMASTGKVDYSFQSEPVLNAGYNPSGQYRPIVNRLWGTVASNLPSSLGLPMYTLMNDDALAARTVGRGAAFMINFSGRHDETVGWAEKLGFFDAMRRYHQGHVDYWDNRDHSGFVYPGGMASNLDPRWLYRFRSTLSWPAFSNCSADDAPGDGTVASGDTLGTINGTMDWDPAVSDSAARWAVTLKTRTIPTLWGTRPAPESLTVDVTPRRVQRFTAAPGTSVTWSAVRISDNATVQQGSVTVDPDGLVTVPQVRTYRTGTRLTLVAPPPGSAFRMHRTARAHCSSAP
jgi:pimeloyl-ACP methyl ester carboxylesterase